jgi:hypothetical protein
VPGLTELFGMTIDGKETTIAYLKKERGPGTDHEAQEAVEVTRWPVALSTGRGGTIQ